MIEKIKWDEQPEDAAKEVQNLIDQLVDTVNAIQKEREAERFEIQEWIGILEAVRKSVNIHEKQIDELQMKIEPEKCETPAENVQKETFISIDEALKMGKKVDPYAEQRRWIGKLCRFWDVATDKGTYGVLTDIKDDRYVCPNGMFMCNRIRYQHCEPVKPDDDIIYKGGDNE